MYSRWPFPPDTPGATEDRVAVVTVVDVPAGLLDGPVPDAVRDPRRAVFGRPGQQWVAVRSDEVIHGLRIISDRVGSTVVVRAIGEVNLRNADGLAAALRAGWATARAPGRLVVDLSVMLICRFALPGPRRPLRYVTLRRRTTDPIQPR